jgi:hypothetical protein
MALPQDVVVPVVVDPATCVQLQEVLLHHLTADWLLVPEVVVVPGHVVLKLEVQAEALPADLVKIFVHHTAFPIMVDRVPQQLLVQQETLHLPVPLVQVVMHIHLIMAAAAAAAGTVQVVLIQAVAVEVLPMLVALV